MAETPDELVVKVRAECDPAVDEVKRLPLREGDRLVLVMAEDFHLTQDNVARLERYAQHTGLTCPLLILPHGTKLAVLGSEEAELLRPNGHGERTEGPEEGHAG